MLPPHDSKIGRKLYFSLLLCLRNLMRVKRRLLDEWQSELAKDLSGILEHVNVIGIVPTVAAVLSTPQRFFRHMHLSRGGPIPFSLSVGSLFMQVCSLGAIVLAVLHVHPNTRQWWLTGHHSVDSRYLLFVCMLAVIASLPLWLTAFSLVLEALFVVMSLWATFGLLIYPVQIITALRHASYQEAIASAVLMVALALFVSLLPWEACRRCRRLIRFFAFSGKKLFDGCFYLGLSLAMMSYVVSLLLFIPSDHSEGIELAIEILLWILTIPALRIVIAGYAAMLEGAATYPRAKFFGRRAETINDEASMIRYHDRRLASAASSGKTLFFKGGGNSARKRLLEEVNATISEILLAFSKLKTHHSLREKCGQEIAKGLERIKDDPSIYFSEQSDIDVIQALLAFRPSPSPFIDPEPKHA